MPKIGNLYYMNTDQCNILITISRRLGLPDNRNFVLGIYVVGVVLKSLKINEVGGKTIYLLC